MPSEIKFLNGENTFKGLVFDLVAKLQSDIIMKYFGDWNTVKEEVEIARVLFCAEEAKGMAYV